jgi:hypothetical protein
MRLPLCAWRGLFPRMSTVVEIETAISRLPLREAEEVREWLEQWLEDQRELTPDFLASIERGKADIAAGRARIVRP